jgi:uncharacterized protein (DUF885 family)
MASGLDAAGWEGVRERLARAHPPASGYLATFDAMWRDCRGVVESEDLCPWPDFPIQYRAMPDWARTAAPYLYFLYYRSPSPFDHLPVVDYLVPPASDEQGLRATNNSVIKQNHVVHHGGIGHHVQNYFAYRSNSAIGQVAAVDCATRIGMFCGGTMAEGWACYATDLMEEVGFLSDLERVALQENRVKQLVRAIVDVELHQETMTLKQGEQFFMDRAGASRTAARSEMTKISMFPGTGMMYWYGTKRIHEMRAALSSILDDSFSLRRFHEDLLSRGSLPVDVIAAGLVGEHVS